MASQACRVWVHEIYVKSPTIMLPNVGKPYQMPRCSVTVDDQAESLPMTACRESTYTCILCAHGLIAILKTRCHQQTTSSENFLGGLESGWRCQSSTKKYTDRVSRFSEPVSFDVCIDSNHSTPHTVSSCPFTPLTLALNCTIPHTRARFWFVAVSLTLGLEGRQETQASSPFQTPTTGPCRVGTKGQFSFQSQRKAMPKNAQTTAQLHSSHTLVK